MRKTIILLTLMFLISLVSVMANHEIIDSASKGTTHNPSGYLNPDNAFDGNDSTSSSLTDTTTTEHFLGKTFNEMFVTKVYYNARVQAIFASADARFRLYSFDGSSWNLEDSYDSVLSDDTWIDTITLNKTVQGLRLGLFVTSSGGVDVGRSIRSLEYENGTNMYLELKNKYNDSVLSGFNATINGTEYNDNNTGYIYTNIPYNNTGVYNLSFKKDGYFNTTYFSITPVDWFNGTVSQSIINLVCLEKVSNNSLTCEPSIIYPNIGTQNLTSSVSGYSNVTQEVTISVFDNKSISFSGFYSSNVSLNSSSINGVVSNCTYTVSSNDYTFSESVTGFPASSVGLINGSYNITSNCVGYASSTQTLLVDASSETLNFAVFEENSISFTIYDLDNLTLVNTSTTNVVLTSDNFSNSYSTSNGTLFVDSLSPDSYSVTFSGTPYTSVNLFVTLAESSHVDVTVYMFSGSAVEFIVQDQTGTLLQNVILTFQQLINGSSVVVGQGETDFSGRSTINLDSTVRYDFFAVKSGYETFTGEVLPTELSYNVIMQEEGTSRFISIYEDLSLQYFLEYNNTNNYAVVYYVLNSPSGLLQYYGMNTTYNSTNYFVNVTGFPAGTIETFNITGVNPSVNPSLEVTYWFKYQGHDYLNWTVLYYMNPVLGVENMTLTTGLFDDLTDLDETNPVRGLIGAALIITFVLIFSFSRDITITVVGGLIGLGINWYYELLPKELLVVSMVVCVGLVLADNIGGGR